ncbi:MAG: DUF1499 domain-containing protein [Hyphomicrobiales bacterium]|nr:DUF1499 domain-containing protein [Hyphomicrobiales bacterium]MBV8826018.1 DUF1499 domain-containing protein [Hyphomicrobiales bacterium]
MAVFAGRNWAEIVATIGAGVAILALLALAVGPLGWRLGWWHYRFAFSWLMPYAACAALAAAVVSIAGLAFGWSQLGSRGVALAAIGIVFGAVVAYMPWQYNRLRGVVPPIHDITTDTENPPAFVAALKLRPPGSNTVAYEGSTVAGKQHAAYPDIVPVKVSLAPADAFKRALDTAKAMPGWTVVDADPASGRIEANQTSRWFRFTDDVVIRVAAEGAGSRIDVRSVSRVGRSDFGVNAGRVRAYTAALNGHG